MIIESIREKADSWWFRGFLALLALTLAFLWYGGDLTTGVSGGRMTLAVVGDEKIDIVAFKRTLDRQISNIQANFDQKIETDQIKQLYPLVFSQLVQEKLLNQEAKRLKIGVTDNQVRTLLMNIPAFRGGSGRFDRQLFDVTLSRLGMTETHFVEELRRNLVQSTLMGGLFQGMGAVNLPTVITQKLFSQLRQTRTVSVVLIPSADMPSPTNPTAQALKSLYGDRAQTVFKAPEYRDIQWLVLDGRIVKDPITITDMEFQTAYDSRAADFKGQQKADIEKRIRADLKTQKINEKLYALTAQIDDAIGGGASLEELAKTYGVSVLTANHVAENGSFDPYAPKKDTMPAADLSGDVGAIVLKESFALGAGTTGNVIEVGEGRYILPRVNHIYPSSPRPYDQVMGDVRDLWIRIEKEKKAKIVAAEVKSDLSGTHAASPKASRKKFKTIKVVLDRNGPVGPSSLSFQANNVEKIFTLRPRDAFVMPMKTDENTLDFLVVRLETITVPPEKKKDADFDTFTSRLKDQLTGELAQQYMVSLEKRFPVKENKEALSQLNKIRFE